MRNHPSLIGHGWELVDSRCRPICHTHPALPTHLPALVPSEESESETESDGEEEESDNDVSRRMTEYSSESDTDSSEAECSDLD